jgi:hypothetical protein
MPWFDFAGMTDDDLSAIWTYLLTVDTHDNEVSGTWTTR